MLIKETEWPAMVAGRKSYGKCRFNCKKMKFSHNMAKCKNLAALLLLFLVAGCLTSPNPFYQEKDIIQDSRFVGTFVSDDSGLTVTISSNQMPDKRYLVHLVEGGKMSDYRATLFKLKDSLFVDIIPISENKVLEQYKEGAPTASGLLKYISHDGKVRSSTRLHVLFRLSLSDKGIECFGAKKVNDPSNPITKDLGLKFHANGDGIVLEETTENLRSIVERYAGATWEQLFQDHGLELIRGKEEPNKSSEAISSHDVDATTSASHAGTNTTKQ